ncbi:MAG: DUF4142 domain-containing protein [Caulobacterales bacterium]
MKSQLCAISLLALAAACGQQASNTAEAPAPAPGEAPMAPVTAAVTPADFVQTIANSDRFEIESSGLAATNAIRADVKEFARMLVTAHTTTSREVATLAPQIQLTPPTPALSAEQTEEVTELRGKAGEEFDDAYLDAQIEAHENAITLFQNFITTSADGPLKQWAQTTLPKLQQHLDRARQLDTAT